MKSLAIWYETRSNYNFKIDDEHRALEAHINVWKLPLGNVWKLPSKKDKFSRFTDIGLLVKNVKYIEKLYVYYPSKIEREHIKDLSKVLRGNFVDVLFNESYNKIEYGNPSNRYYKIADSSNKEIFQIYNLGESQISVTHHDDFGRIGTIICIEIKGLEKRKKRNSFPDNVYLRFRIDHDYSTVFSYTEIVPFSLFKTSFLRNEIVDFRINEIRELSESLISKMSDNGSLYIFSKIHFLFVCSYREEIVTSYMPYVKTRQLEKESWREYIGADRLKNVKGNQIILAHQWKIIKDKDFIKDFNALVRVRFEFASSFRYLAYLLGIILVNILSSYVWLLLNNFFA